MSEKDTYERQGVHYTFKKGCFGRHPLLKWLGDGAFGTVFQTCNENGDDCNYIIKMIPLDVCIPRRGRVSALPLEGQRCIKETREHFMRESKITKQLSDNGVGPQFLAWGICPDVTNEYQKEGFDVGYIIQEKWDMTLNEYLKRYPQKFLEDVNNIIYPRLLKAAKQMDELKLIHNDLHLENIILKLDENNKVIDATFIDFGDVITTKEFQAKRESWKDKDNVWILDQYMGEAKDDAISAMLSSM